MTKPFEFFYKQLIQVIPVYGNQESFKCSTNNQSTHKNEALVSNRNFAITMSKLCSLTHTFVKPGLAITAQRTTLKSTYFKKAWSIQTNVRLNTNYLLKSQGASVYSNSPVTHFQRTCSMPVKSKKDISNTWLARSD